MFINTLTHLRKIPVTSDFVRPGLTSFSSFDVAMATSLSDKTALSNVSVRTLKNTGFCVSRVKPCAFFSILNFKIYL